MKFNRRKIETICIFISFVLVLLLSLIGIMALADSLFGWDILSEKMENLAYMFIGTTGIVIGATFLISLMVNLSLISLNMEKIANWLIKKE